MATKIAAREQWLYDNPEALAAVRNGLQQARAGELVDGPNLEEVQHGRPESNRPATPEGSA